MKHNFFETILGAFVLCVAGIFLYIAYFTSSSNVPDGYLLTAKFNKVDGIVNGSDVRLAGVKVGHVKKIDIDLKSYKAIVSFNMRSDIKIPVDTSAEIASDGLLGGKYLNISPGGSDDTLNDNEEIETTQSSISLEELVGKFLFSSTEKDEKKS